MANSQAAKLIPDPRHKPTTYQIDFTEAPLPAALLPLTTQPRWVCWRWEWRRGKRTKGKWTKPPIQPGKGFPTYAESNDPATWGTFTEAMQRVTQGDADGIGFCLLGSDVAAVDLDHCRDHTGITAWALDLAGKAPKSTYCEVTVSGQGFRLIGLGTGSELHRKFPAADGKGSFELYRNAARYITVSGKAVAGATGPLPKIDSLLDGLLTEASRRPDKGNGGYFGGLGGGVAALERIVMAHRFQHLNPKHNLCDDIVISERDESGSGHGWRFMQDCHARRLDYQTARAAILADNTEAGEWANRTDERQLERAWERSKPALDPTSSGALPSLTWDPAELRISYANVRHRPWLYGTYLMRGEVTIIAAPGGVGKTALTTGIATELTVNVVLMDDKIWGSNLKVLAINGEDGKDEITRRMWAFARAHVDKITEQPPDNFYAIGAEDDRVQHMSFLQTNERNVSTLNISGFEILASALDALRPDVVIIDPFVAFCSGGNMNDNALMAQVMRKLKSLAIKYDCSILIVHHNRKGGERDNQESIGGAAAIVNLARCALMPVPMTTEEAPKLGVLPSERHRYFKLVNAKPNFTPESEDSPWYQLHNITISNPEPPLYEHGDGVQAVTRVALPLAKNSAEAAVDQKVQRAILDLVDHGKLIDGERHPYSPNTTGAQNTRALLDDALTVVAHATAPKQWLPGDLRAIVHTTIDKMRGDGWLYEEPIIKGRFRQGRGLYVNWQLTPWPNSAGTGASVDELLDEVADMLEQTPDAE
jgi:hypothetical protein